jgi:hypothetical protein
MTAQHVRAADTSPASLQQGRWDGHLFHLLVVSGAATVVAGSYATWATFYAGLISRNGVSGHGKYFIGLAAAATLVALLSSIHSVWSGLRWMVVPLALIIAAIALRDLRNLDVLVGDPAAGFYLPGRGLGLLIVITGAIVLALSPIARPVRAAPAARLAPTIAALALVTGVAALVPGLYGEYYLHVANGHAHDHVEAFNEAHIVTAMGVMLLLVAMHVALIARLRASTAP